MHGARPAPPLTAVPSDLREAWGVGIDAVSDRLGEASP